MSWLDILGMLIVNGAFTVLVNWLTQRRLKKTEANKNEAETQNLLGDAYSKLIKDLTTQIDHLKRINDELEVSKDRMIRELHELGSEVVQLRKTVVKLTNRLKSYEDSEKEIS